MNTNPSPRCSSQELAQQITQRIEELAQATDAARVSEEMIRYLDTFSKFFFLERRAPGWVALL